MAAYVQPQVLVFQEAQQIPFELTAPLRACIIGPNAQLFRYGVADEKSQIGLGDYADYYSDGGSFAWPGRPAGAQVDPDYVKLFIDDALLLYYENAASSGEAVAPTAGYANRITIADAVEPGAGFVENGVDFPRISTLLDRDVRVGDRAQITGLGSDDEVYEVNTYVQAIVGEEIGAEVADAVADDNNGGTQSAAAVIEQTAGEDTGLTLDVDLTDYNALPDGNITDVYTITVERSSVGGDLHSALVRIRSASGDDPTRRHYPAAVGEYKEMGGRGLLVRWTDSSVSASPPSGSEGNLIVGQVWRIEITDNYVEITPVSGGTYTGAVDTTYIVEVTRGGLFTAPSEELPQIKCVTVDGSDASGPVIVPAAATAVTCGTYGVTITFNGVSPPGLRKGDKFYIDVTAVSAGRMSTLVLGHNLPEALRDAADLGLKLYIRKDLEITQNRVGFEPDTNWEVSDTEFTVAAGIIAYDPTWTDGGVEEALPVVGGRMYVEYRAFLADLCSEINAIQDVGEIDAIPGALSPDNPLKWGVYKALTNSNGTAVKYIAVCDPTTLTSWTDALGVTVGRDDVYGIVPLTRDQAVLDACVANVNAQSSAEAGRWRSVWVSLLGRTEKAVVSAATSTDGELVLATLADDPETSDTQYTLLEVPGGNAAFLTNGVRAGDTVRYLYTTSFGEPSWTEFVVDAVLSEDSLRLLTGHSVAIGVAQKIEVWHPLSRTEMAADVASQAAAYGNKRVRAVWPDVVSSGGTSMEGYHLCAALAGLRSGVVPQQGLTNVELAGFDDLSRTTDLFNQDQLNVMAASGVWIVTKNSAGNVVARHALSTNRSGLTEQEEMITANVDSISYFFQTQFAPYIGRSNVTPSFLSVLRALTESGIAYLKSVNYLERLGAQLIDATIVELRQHAVLRDRIVIVLSLQVPAPANNIEVYLVV